MAETRESGDYPMATVRHLSKAPITEAILDFRVRLPADVQVETLRNALPQLASAYPNVEDAWLIDGSCAFSSEFGNPLSPSSKRANGFFLRSPVGKQVAQFRLDGFTFSRLAPYTSWEEIEPEAFRLWEVYRGAAKPEALFRVAVRYINHIRLPETALELNDILVSAPEGPGELPRTLASFLTRVVVPLSMPNTHVGVVQAYNVPPAVVADTLLLDVDVSRNEEMDLSSATLRPVFEQLREFKNLAFFGSLTEQIVRVFE